MPRITYYSFLFQDMLGKTGTNLVGSFKLSQINSSSVQAQLKAAGINTNSKQYKAAGINTNSKQYKAALGVMMKNGNGMMYANIQGIKNLMSQYDEDGDYIDPTTGLAGLVVTDENKAQKNKIISIPESSKDEMFELTKKEFLRENGALNGDTTKRSDVYTNMYRKVAKEERLAAGNTLSQYERAYRQAFVDVVKEADVGWEIGKPIKAGILDSITREIVETKIHIPKSVDVKI